MASSADVQTKRNGTRKRSATLNNVYYNPAQPGSLGGLKNLSRYAKVSKRETKDWSMGENTYTLHKPVRYKFPRRKIIVGGIDSLWQLDLVDISRYKNNNKGNKFLLTCIDVFSKYAFVQMIKSKSGQNVTEAFEAILKEGRRPKTIQTDKGKEFINNTFQNCLMRNGIDFYTSENDDIKAAVVERFNRTLMNKIHRYMTKYHTSAFIKVLSDIVYSYNHTKHRSIGIAPAAVNEKNSENLWWRLYKPNASDWTTRKQVLSVGDHVRISKTRLTFKKGYLPSWSTEIFRVKTIHKTKPLTYGLVDLLDEDIKGRFYYQELERVKPPTYFDVENIVKKRKRGGKTEYFVKWLGYGSKFNSWVSEQEIKRL